MSRYDADDTYCITGTSVLKNKAGITDQNLLDEFEADFTAIRLLELAQTPVIGVFDLAHLCKIHEYLFQDVYDWAGKTRSVDIVRGNSRFCNVRQIDSYSNKVFKELAAENYLLNLKPKDFARRLAHYLSEINALHPFREGNGRVQRIFISQLAENAGYNLDYSALDQASLYPEDVIRRRFKAGLENFQNGYRNLVDSWAFYDSYHRPPKLLDWSNK